MSTVLIKYQRGKAKHGSVRNTLWAAFCKRMFGVFSRLVRIFQTRMEFSFSLFSRTHPFFHLSIKNTKRIREHVVLGIILF